MTNFVQLLTEDHPLVAAARTELQALALNYLNFGDTFDGTKENCQVLLDHLTNVGDAHAILFSLGQEELLASAPNTRCLFSELSIEAAAIDYFQFFVARPASRGVVHIDGNYWHCCLNMPLFNGDSGTVEWFGTHNFPAAPTRVSHVGTRGTYPERRDDCYTNETPDEAVITRGLQLVKTDIWHRANNKLNDRYRLVFSARLMFNPTFEDVLKRVWPAALRLQLAHVG